MHFRRVLHSDKEDWLPFFLDPESTRYWEGIPSDPEEACRQQFERIFERYQKGLGGLNALIHKETGSFIGLAGLLTQEVDGQEELEIAYSLLPRFRHQGFAAEAAQRCLEIAFHRNYASSLISIIHTGNIPSQRVAEKIGMRISSQTQYKDNPVYIFRTFG